MGAIKQAFCKICGANSNLKYLRVKSQYTKFAPSIFQCAECGHGVTSPVPSEEELTKMYSDTYSISDHIMVRAEKRSRASFWKSFILQTIEVKNIVEIGSMFGDFLSTFNEMGVPLLGIEQDPNASEIACKSGLQTVCSPFSQVKNIPTGHNATEIFMTHTLEHMPDLDIFFQHLEELFPNLEYFFAVVPNFNSTLRKLTGTKWGSLQVGPHFNHFTPESLSRVLENQDFQIIKLKTRGGDSLFYISTIINLLGLNALRRRKINILKKLFFIPILFMRGAAFLLQDILNDEVLVLAKKKHISSEV